MAEVVSRDEQQLATREPYDVPARNGQLTLTLANKHAAAHLFDRLGEESPCLTSALGLICIGHTTAIKAATCQEDHTQFGSNCYDLT